MSEQQDYPAIDRRHSGLVAGEEQPGTQPRDTVIGQLRVSGCCCGQIGDHTIARFGLLVLHPGHGDRARRELGTSHSTVSGIVDRLQARSLVQRVQDDADRRYTRIRVTERVDHYVQNMEVGAFGRLATALGNATDEQRRTIHDGLALLRALLS